MVDVDLIRNKIAQLAEYLIDLQEVELGTIEEFQADKKTRRYVERTLHLAVECCLDIGSHIIADNGWREPITNKDIFLVFLENGVFNKENLSNLQRMAQFRNVLVHDYAKLDPTIIYTVVKKELKDLSDFMIAIDQLL